MKEATGELNMTVITIVAIAAVAAFFYLFVWPAIKVSIANSQCEATCGKNNFAEATRQNIGGGGSNKTGADAGAVAGDWECKCGTGSGN